MRLGDAQIREFAHVRVSPGEKSREGEVERGGERRGVHHRVAGVHRVHVMSPAPRRVFRPLVIPSVQDHVRAESLRAHRGGFLRRHHRQLLLLPGHAVDGAIERRSRRRARRKQHAQRAVASLQDERVRHPGEKRVQRGGTTRGEKQTGVFLALETNTSGSGSRFRRARTLTRRRERYTQPGKLDAIHGDNLERPRGGYPRHGGGGSRDGGGGADHGADDAAATSRERRRIHLRRSPRQAVREALHGGEATRQRSKRLRRGSRGGLGRGGRRPDSRRLRLRLGAQHGGGV